MQSDDERQAASGDGVSGDLLVLAIDVMGSEKAAQEWLTRPAMALNRSRPIDLMITPSGYQMVWDLLQRLNYGVYT